ncbi:MAG: hypothetical protein KAV87_15075, partial [Desulfobacteraceae bacterium]|nr:hypothetical protein [Desulfobacteraceae bacterium]
MKIRILKAEKGIALLVVLIYTIIFTILGFSMLTLAGSETILTYMEADSAKAFYAAEAGLEYGVAQLNKLLGEHRQAIDLEDEGDIVERHEIPFPVVEGFTFDAFTIEKVGAAEAKVVESGPYKGMEALIQKYKIISQTTSNTSKAASVRLVQQIEDQMLYLFQFAAFYDEDLEIAPGPPMNIKGRIHSNNNIYLSSNNTLYIDSHLTSTRDIYRGGKPGKQSVGEGDVYIKDALGDYKSMDFDSTDPDWATKALETWGGRVQSQVHALPTISVPIPIEDEPIELIKRGKTGDAQTLREARLYWQADLRIIDGVAYDKSGNVQDLTYDKDGNSVNPVDTSKSFYYHREQKVIKLTEIDISKLVESGKFPANGILYVSTQSAGAGEQDGVRLVNGSVLPPGGLTVATDNPLYIQGDYNRDNKPASVLCDAINFLSNSWQDGEAWQSATDTEVNTSFSAGHKPTTHEGYGGGLENLPRFLE